MTSVSSYPGLFGSLHLSSTDTTWLQGLVPTLVREHIESYERHIQQDKRRLDQRRWKLVTKRENVRVFSEQAMPRGSSGGGDGGGQGSASRTPRKNAAGAEVGAALADMPTLLLVGTIEGSLDDAMYGVLNPTVDSMRVKSSYVGDKFANCAVLATLERPTSRDPFRSLTLKWFEGDHPHIFRPIVRNRDFVFMEATGLAKLSSGEAIGYHVMHSVHFPEARAIGSNIRAHMAVCGLYGQRSDGVVDVFTKTTANPGGHVASAIAVKYASMALASAQKLIDCAHLKKLAWMVSRRMPSATGSGSGSTASSTRSHHSFNSRDANTARVCFTCGEGASYRRLSIPRYDVCTLCGRQMCSACKVTKELSFIDGNGGLMRHKMRFCQPCVSDAKHVSARAVACDEFATMRSEASARSYNYTTRLASPSASDPGVFTLRPSAFTS
ncbi:hypothetical protein BBJ28_00022110 [Nothophytophthora sp. Chile5]|nr:hypothetical protein BBJ28_00022110 [Nothophytophthora sp. Chile5]